MFIICRKSVEMISQTCVKINPEMSGQSAEERDNEEDDFKPEESEITDDTNNPSYLNTVKTIC